MSAADILYICPCGAPVRFNEPHVCTLLSKSFTPVITHAGTQWAKLCLAYNLDPDTAKVDDILCREWPGKRSRLPRVYVAGPYTHGDVAQNVRNAILCADWLAERGCVPFVPHLSHLWHTVSPHPYDFWITQDLEWLRGCDALVRLPGYSQGAGNEVRAARELGLPVFMWPAEGECVKGFAEWREGWGK